VFTLYWIVPRKYQNSVLLISSYIFYSAWDWRFISLIFLSTIVDYVVAKKIEISSGNKKRLLTISIITNLGILGIFKYFGFFVNQFNTLFMTVGLDLFIPSISLILPVGISFYTFQTMSYTLDVYKGNTKPIQNLFDFALYVSFFPQLVAGPIERSHRLLPQIIKQRIFRQVQFGEGLYYVIYGLFLKVVIADNMAIIANSVYSNPYETQHGLDVVMGTYAFAFQIYGDFAGYSFIAIGIAKWLGIHLMKNFNSPYLADSPSDFWQRWHISLSSWLKDYLYIPLGGNRKGSWLTGRNLIITMVLGGLWHGAGWTFIAWGFFHGLILIIYKIVREWLTSRFVINDKLHLLKLFRIFILFHLICISWVFFRADTIGQVWVLFNQIFFNLSFSNHTVGMMSIIIFYITPMLIYEIWNEGQSHTSFNERSTFSLLLFFNYCFFMILVFPAPSHQEFIYFQF